MQKGPPVVVLRFKHWISSRSSHVAHVVVVQYPLCGVLETLEPNVRLRCVTQTLSSSHCPSNLSYKESLMSFRDNPPPNKRLELCSTLKFLSLFFSFSSLARLRTCSSDEMRQEHNNILQVFLSSGSVFVSQKGHSHSKLMYQ